MKIPLAYQISEYDCGTTSFYNALSYIFARSELPPDVLKHVSAVTLDTYSEAGELGKLGTSRASMAYLVEWLNQNGPRKNLPIVCEYYSGDAVSIKEGSPLIDALKKQQGVILRLDYGGEHYVLATDVDEENQYIYLFDPYLDEDLKYSDGVVLLEDAPEKYNRKIPWRFFEEGGPENIYALGSVPLREAIVVGRKC